MLTKIKLLHHHCQKIEFCIFQKKCDIFTYLTTQNKQIVFESPEVDAKAIDNAAVIDMVVPSSGKKIQGYIINTID